jgi:hypothetical protein
VSRNNIKNIWDKIYVEIYLIKRNWYVCVYLLFFREFGSSIEKAFYKDMTVPELIDRLLLKRAVTFMDAQDSYKLLTGEEE